MKKTNKKYNEVNKTNNYRKREVGSRRLFFELLILLSIFALLLIFVSTNQRIVKKVDYYELAVSSGDYTLCSNINIDDLRVRCYIRVLTDLSDERDNPKYCNMITTFVEGTIGKEYAEKCLNNYYFMKSLNTMDIGFCNQINDQMLRSSCRNHIYDQLQHLMNKNEECFGIKNVERKIMCFRLNFRELKNYKLTSEFCENFENYYEKRACELELQ